MYDLENDECKLFFFRLTSNRKQRQVWLVKNSPHRFIIGSPEVGVIMFHSVSRTTAGSSLWGNYPDALKHKRTPDPWGLKPNPRGCTLTEGRVIPGTVHFRRDDAHIRAEQTASARGSWCSSGEENERSALARGNYRNRYEWRGEARGRER